VELESFGLPLAGRVPLTRPKLRIGEGAVVVGHEQ
jgi:hypothetical protein